MAVVLALPLAGAEAAPALPSGGQFVAGVGTITPNGVNGLTINQATGRGIIDWRNFSIGAGGAVNINNGAGATLNRVTGGQLSQIEGTLTATGSVYLVNPQGIVVGSGGKILSGGGVVLSTRNISNDAFMSGGSMIATGTSIGDVTNKGTVLARTGDVVIIGHSVDNTGSISAPNGTATLAAGNTVILSQVGGSSGVVVDADPSATGDVTQAGTVQAAAAALTAAGGNVYSLAGNTGVTQATGAATIDGHVYLTAPNGAVTVAGAVSARNADGTGGSIIANGKTVNVASTAILDARGTSGGQVLVGVSAPQTNLADKTTIADGAQILAGGVGGGGHIETSGHTFSLGAAKISTGQGGSWLVDPTDLTIDSATATTIDGTLNGGGNVSLTTTATTTSGPGVTSAGAGDIVVASALSWTGSGNLTLNAFHDAKINAGITSTGSGGLTVTAGNGVQVGAAVSAHTVSMAANGSTLEIMAGGSVAGNTGVTLSSNTSFVNDNATGGSSVTSSGGKYLIYSVNPNSDTVGNLTPAFIQYGAAVNATPLGTGNGLLYSVAPTLNYSVIGTVTKVYDGTTAATLSGGNLSASGLLTGDVITLAGGGAATYSQSDVGNSLTVTLASAPVVTRGGVTVLGYTVGTQQPQGVIGSITARPLSVDLTGTVTKVYDATPDAQLTGANFAIEAATANTGLVGTDSVFITPGPSTASYLGGVDAGSHLLSVTLTNTSFSTPTTGPGSTTKLTNYILPTTVTNAATFTGAITPFALTTENIKALDQSYTGTAGASLDLSAADLVGVMNNDNVHLDTANLVGVFHNGGAAGSGLTVDLSLINGSTGLTGTKAADYTLVLPTTIKAGINTVSVSLTGVTSTNKTYDGTTSATSNVSFTTAALTGVVAADKIGGVSTNAIDTTKINFSPTGATAVFSQSNVGNNLTITLTGVNLTGTQQADYTLAPIVVPTASILPALLTVSVIDAATGKVYDGSTAATIDPSKYTVTGWVNGETGSITQTATATYAASNAGTHDVAITLEVSDFTTSGSIFNYYTTGTPLAPSLHTPLTSHNNVISQAPLTITIVGDPTKVFDGNTNFDATTNNSGVNAGVGLVGANYLISGFVPGESGTINQATGTFVDSNAGQFKSISAAITAGNFNLTGTNTAGAAASISNYTFSGTVTGFGTITPAPLSGGLSATFGPNDKTYDGNANIENIIAGNFNVTGWQAGDGGDVTFNLGAADANIISALYATKNVGLQPVLVDVNANRVGGSTTNFTFFQSATTNLSNYTLPTSFAGFGTILAKVLTASIIGAPTKVYDGTTLINPLLSTNYSISTGVAGETITINQALGSFNSANVTQANTVTATLGQSNFSIAGAGALLSNYVLPTVASGAGTITRAPLTVINVGADSKVYDGTNVATLELAGDSLQGVVQGDAISLINPTSAIFPSIHVGANYTITPNVAFALSGTVLAQSNYTLVQPTLTASITPKGLTITTVSATTKVYDGTTAAALNASGLTGLINSDPVTLNTVGATGVFEQANVGTGLKVTASGYALNGNTFGDYTLSQPTGLTANITPAPLSGAIIDDPTKTYNGTTTVNLNSGNFQITGWVNGEGGDVTVTHAASSFYGSADAGTQDVTANLTISNFNAPTTLMSNYFLPGGTSRAAGTITTVGAGTINRAPLIAQIINNPTKIYNANTDTDDGAVLTSNNFALLGFVGTQGATVTGAISGTYNNNGNAGINVITAALTPGDFTAFTGANATNLNNYILPTSAFGGGTITPFQLSISGAAAQNKVYDAGFNAVVTAGTPVGVFSRDNGNVSIVAGTGQFVSKDVANGISVTASGYTLTGSAASNYTVVQPTGLTANITPAPVTIVATKTYDGTNFAFVSGGSNQPVYTLQGVFGGDTVTTSGSGTAGTYSSPHVNGVIANATVTGLAGVTLAGAQSGDYQIVGATGVINPLQLTVSGAVAVDKTYDTTTAATINNSATVLNGVLTPDVGFVTLNPANTTTTVAGTFASPNAGTNIVVTTSAYSLVGNTNGDYSLLQPSPLHANINQATLIINLVSVTKVYDGTTALPTASTGYVISGILGSDVVNVASATGQYDVAGGHVGNNIPIDVTAINLGGAQGGNYTAALPALGSTIGFITPAQLTLSIVGSPTKVYDGNTSATLTGSNYQLTGLVHGETATVNADALLLTGSTYNSKDVSAATTLTVNGVSASEINFGTALSSDYAVTTSASGSGSITPKGLNLTSITKTYDGNNTLTAGNSAFVLSQTGVIGGDTVALVTTGVNNSTYGSNQAGSGYTVTLHGLVLNNSNYAINTPGTIGVINLRPLTLASVIKTYDGGNSLTNGNSIFTLDMSNVVGGDTVTLNTGGLTAGGTYSGTNAGSGYTVSVSGLALSNPNYSLSTSGPIGTINRAPLTLTLSDITKVYDGTGSATVVPTDFVFGGFVNGESASVDVSDNGITGNFNHGAIHVGSGYQIFSTVNLLLDLIATGGFNLNNYTINGSIAGGNVTLFSNNASSITPVFLNMTSITKIYDGGNTLTGANSVFVLSHTGVIGSDTVAVDASGVTAGTYGQINVGSGYAVTAPGLTLTNPDYALNPLGNIGVITPKGLNLASITKVYDQTNSLTLGNSVFVLSQAGVVSGDTVTLITGGLGAGATYGSTQAGSGYSVSVSGLTLSNPNYSLNTPGLIGVITPIQLNLSSITKIYDGGNSLTNGNSILTLSQTGVLGGDTVGLITTGLNNSTYGSTQAGSGYSVTLNGVTLSNPNYSLAIPGLIGAITAKPIDLTSITKVYDQTNSLTAGNSVFVLNAAQIVGSDVVTVNTSGLNNSTYGSTQAGSGYSVTLNGVTLSNPNYSLNVPGLIGVITPIQLNLSSITKVYDGGNSLTNGNSILTLSQTGVLGGDTVGLITTGLNNSTYGSTQAGSGYSVTLNGVTLSNPNYSLAIPGLIGAITAKPIDLTSITKVYDQTNSLTAGNSVFVLNVAQIVGSDVVTVNTSGLNNSTYGSTQAGSGYSVTLNGVTLSNPNYSLNVPGLIGVITPIQLNLSSITKVYDQTNSLTNGNSILTLSQTGVLSGDTVNLITTGLNNSTYGSTQAGSGYSVTLNGVTLSNPNYSLNVPGLIGAITPIHLDLSSITKIYDGGNTLTNGNSTFVLSTAGVISGDTVTLNTAGLTAGSTYGSTQAGSGYSVSVGGLTLSNSNYSLNIPGLIGVITPKALDLASITKVYDQGNSLTAGNSIFVLNAAQIVGADVVTVNTSGLNNSTYGSTQAGSGYSVTLNGVTLSNPNYSLNTPGLIGVITPIQLNLSSITKIYDGGNTLTNGNSTFVLSTAGVISGDTVTLNTAGLTAGSTYGSTQAGSGYSVSVGGLTLSNSNYSLNIPGLIGVITPKALTASFDPTTKVYDGNTTTATLTGFVLNGFVTGESGTITGAPTTTTYGVADVMPSPQSLSASLVSAIFNAGSGTSLSNYSLPTVALSTGTITPLQLTASFANTTKQYDQTLITAPLTGYTLTGFIAGQSGTISNAPTTGLYGVKDVTTTAQTITVSLTGATFNLAAGTNPLDYINPTIATGLGTITPAPLTITGLAVFNKVYDGATSATLDGSHAGSLMGVFAGDHVILVTGPNSASFTSPNVANGIPINLTGGSIGGSDAIDYTLSQASPITANITPKQLTAVISGTPTKTYDGTTVATLTPGDYTLGGFIGGQGGTVTQTVGTYASPNAGPEGVSAVLGSGTIAPLSGTLLGNYILPTSAVGVGLINQAPLTAIIIGTPTKPADGTTVATLTPPNFQITGLVGGETLTVNQTVGAYASPTAGPETVSALLGGGNFVAGLGTLLSNYILPTSASGPGLITAVAPPPPPVSPITPLATRTNPASTIVAQLTLLGVDISPALMGAIREANFTIADVRTYIPYPAPGALSSWRNNGWGTLPIVIDDTTDYTQTKDDDGNLAVQSGAPVINSTEQVMLSGVKNKRWRITIPRFGVGPSLFAAGQVVAGQ